MTFPNASLQKEGSFVSSSSSALPADVPRSAPPPISPRVIDSLAAALSARPASGSGPLSPASPPAPGTMLLHRVVVEIPVIPDPNEKSVVLQFIQFLGGALFVWVGHSGCAKLEDLHVAFPNNSNPSSSPATSSTRVFGEEEGVSGQLAAKLGKNWPEKQIEKRGGKMKWSEAFDGYEIKWMKASNSNRKKRATQPVWLKFRAKVLAVKGDS
eukprot:GHVT01076281.1.p1 GENE.GHVT01076281.1~~GHVT01076281.1.p1  ORF type:complete len:225 (+),score=47.66 GHVT01076281.1:40-675(+)